MTIFRDEFDVRFIVLFGGLLFCKIFHWGVGDRVDFMDQGEAPGRGFHVRIVVLCACFLIIDLGMLGYAIEYTIRRGPSMMIIFGFEYTILVSLISSTFCKYILHSIDLASPNPWDDKSMYIFYLDLLIDFFKLITYILFFSIVVHYYGLPLHIIRDLYLTLRSFLGKCRDLIAYRRATSNMNERYPTATAEELEDGDRTCIICREEMIGGGVEGGPETPKKLPCGHIFHMGCLKSWLERQQSCPTCRQSVLTVPVPPLAAVAPVNVQDAAAPFIQNGQWNFPVQGGLGALPGFQQPLQQQGVMAGDRVQQPIVQPLQHGVPAQFNHQHLNIPLTPQQQFSIPNQQYPVTLTPLFHPSTTTPTAVLDCLTDEQLAGIEGTSRECIIERLRVIQSVQEQLVGVVTQLVQVLSCMPGDDATGVRIASNGRVREEAASGGSSSTASGSAYVKTEATGTDSGGSSSSAGIPVPK